MARNQAASAQAAAAVASGLGRPDPWRETRAHLRGGSGGGGNGSNSGAGRRQSGTRGKRNSSSSTTTNGQVRGDEEEKELGRTAVEQKLAAQGSDEGNTDGSSNLDGRVDRMVKRERAFSLMLFHPNQSNGMPDG